MLCNPVPIAAIIHSQDSHFLFNEVNKTKNAVCNVIKKPENAKSPEEFPVAEAYCCKALTLVTPSMNIK